jgi:hypothetical protein
MDDATASPSKTATDVATASPIIAPVENLLNCEFALLDCVFKDGECGPAVRRGSGTGRGSFILALPPNWNAVTYHERCGYGGRVAQNSRLRGVDEG